MEKDVCQKHTERFDYEQGYRNAFLFRLKELGVKNVYEPGSDTGKQDADFVNLMTATHNALREEIHSRKAITKYDLEKLVADSDNFTVQFQKDKRLSLEVEAAWREYKRNYLIDLIKEQEKEKLAENAKTRKSSRLKAVCLNLARLAIYGAVTAAAVAGGTYAVYEYFIKPDVKREIGEVREEIMSNQVGLSSEDINRICDTVEERYPFFNNMKKPAESKKEK